MRFVIIALFLLFGGCASKEFIYPDSLAVVHPIAKIDLFLGVYHFHIPQYLEDGRVPYKDEEAIKYFDVIFSYDPKATLKRRLIEDLKNALQDPFIVDYPWETSKQPQALLDIDIKRLLCDREKGVIEIEGEWTMRRKGKIVENGHFYKKIFCPEDPTKIAFAMMQLLDRFAIQIAKSLQRQIDLI